MNTLASTSASRFRVRADTFPTIAGVVPLLAAIAAPTPLPPPIAASSHCNGSACCVVNWPITQRTIAGPQITNPNPINHVAIAMNTQPVNRADHSRSASLWCVLV